MSSKKLVKNYLKQQSKLYNFKSSTSQDISQTGISGFSNPHTIKEVLSEGYFKKLIRKSQRVLDLGCNNGRFLNALKIEHPSIKGYGIDLSKKSIEFAQKNAIDSNKFIVGDVQKKNYKNNFFDLIYSFDVFEHIPNLSTTLSEINKMLKKGGYLYIYTINKKNFLTLNWFIQKITFNKRGWGEYNDHKPELMVDPIVLKKELIARNFDILEINYFHAFFTHLFDIYFIKYLFDLKNLLSKKQTIVEDNSSARQKRNNKSTKNKRNIKKFLKKTYALLKIFDILWTSFGRSNGFFLIARKK